MGHAYITNPIPSLTLYVSCLAQVLKEIDAATKAFPSAYVRMAAFDANRQVQVVSMLVHRPPGAKDYRLPEDRRV